MINRTRDPDALNLDDIITAQVMRRRARSSQGLKIDPEPVPMPQDTVIEALTTTIREAVALDPDPDFAGWMAVFDLAEKLSLTVVVVDRRDEEGADLTAIGSTSLHQALALAVGKGDADGIEAVREAVERVLVQIPGPGSFDYPPMRRSS